MVDSFIYVVVFFLLFFIMYCYEKSRNKAITFFCCISAFYILFLFMALRYNVGADYCNYINLIQEALLSDNYLLFEIGWYPLFFLMDFFYLPPHFFFVITAFINSLLIIKIIDKKYATVGICLYLCLGYIEQFSVTRQCFAATIYAYYFSCYLKTGKIKKLFWGGFISGLFHTSLFVTLIQIPLTLYLKKKEIKWSNRKTLLIFLFLLLVFKVINLGVFVLNVASYTPYSVYLNMGESLIGITKNRTGIGMLLRYCILLGCCFELHRTQRRNPYTYIDGIKLCNIYILLIFFLLSEQVRIFMRLPLIFNTSLCCLYMESKGRVRKIQFFCVIIACFLLYFFTILRSTRDIKGSWDLLPYYTIFRSIVEV